MTPLDTVVVCFRPHPEHQAVDTARHELFARSLCDALAAYSYGPDGIVFVGWDDIEEAAGDVLDEDTAVLTITPLDPDGGFIALGVPQYEMAHSKTVEFAFALPEDEDAIDAEAKSVAERLVTDTGRTVPHTLPYDVALSFASEQRDYVRAVAQALEDVRIRVFFDENEIAAIWGKDFVETFTDVYAKQALRIVMFISTEYANKAWPTVEKRAALSTVLADPTGARVLPVRFDDTEVPGLPASTVYVNASDHNPIELAELIAENLRQSGHLTAANWDLAGKRETRANRIQFTALIDHGDLVRYEIRNPTDTAIDNVMLVVADPWRPESDPKNQIGTALELVIGVIPAKDTIAGEERVRFSEPPLFDSLPRLGTLLWTDSDGDHWAAHGAQVDAGHTHRAFADHHQHSPPEPEEERPSGGCRRPAPLRARRPGASDRGSRTGRRRTWPVVAAWEDGPMPGGTMSTRARTGHVLELRAPCRWSDHCGPLGEPSLGPCLEAGSGHERRFPQRQRRRPYRAHR